MCMNLHKYLRVLIVSALATLFIASSANAFYLPNSETKQRAANGDIEAQYKLARYHHRRGELHTAYQWYERAAELGHSEAQNHMGAAHMSGIEDAGLPKDWEKAKYWLSKSAASGNAIAKASLKNLNHQIQRKLETENTPKSNARETPLTPIFDEEELNKAIYLANKSRQDGIVYKSPSYWEKYRGMERLIAIFEGRFNSIEIPSLIGRDFISYIDKYSEVCSSHIPKDQLKTYEVLYTVMADDGYDWNGEKQYKEEIHTETYYLHNRFYKRYVQLRESGTVSGKDRIDILNTKREGVENQIMKRNGWLHTETVPEFGSSLSRFFSENKCDSATMLQMNENLWRITNKKPSAQSANIKFANAASETSPVKDDFIKPTVFSAIFDNELLASRLSILKGHGRHKDVDYSLCMSHQIRARVRPENLHKISRNYMEYINIGSWGTKPPEYLGWRVKEAVEACRLLLTNFETANDKQYRNLISAEIKSDFMKDWVSQRKKLIKISDPTLENQWISYKKSKQKERVIGEQASEHFLKENAKDPSVKMLEGGVQYKIIQSGPGKPITHKNQLIAAIFSWTNDEEKLGKTYFSMERHLLTYENMSHGLAHALKKMKEGDHWRIYVPSNLHGGTSLGNEISTNEVAIFDVKIVKINPNSLEKRNLRRESTRFEKEFKKELSLKPEALRTTQKYRAKNNAPAKPEWIRTKSGLLYMIVKEGRGSKPTPSDLVTYHSYLSLPNGTTIENTFRTYKPKTNNRVSSIPIQGIKEGIQLLKPGGKIQLQIHPRLAFGGRRIGKIPANATILAEIELISIN